MNILKYKYKAHKLINYAFYLVVFLIGFGIGFSAKKIDFNKLISNFLMIDNVSAFTIVESGSLTVDEEFIYNSMFNETGYNFEDYPYLICKYYYFVNSNSYGAIECDGYSSLDFLSITKYHSSDKYFSYYYPANGLRYYIRFQKSTGQILQRYFTDLSVSGNSSDLYFKGNGNTSNDKNKVYTNFNFINGDYLTYVNPIVNKLDFSDYSVNLEFNENLFKDNPDFKEVCVENNKVFAITRATNSEVNEYFDYDYIWFPYGLDGLAKGLYDSSLDDKFSYYNEQDTFGYYWFKDKENIDNYFNSDIPGLELEMKDYTNKYSYYGWSAHYFRMYFEGENTQFTIFKFVNPTTLTYNDETNTNHGGGGLRLDGDEEIQISNNYCFYVKNEYEVQYINVDEWGDYYGTVITPNGDYDFNTSYNKNNSNSESFLSQPITFINSMKDTIIFINSLIYEFYMSLPVLFRAFIITLFIILIIMLIMKIGGYK